MIGSGDAHRRGFISRSGIWDATISFFFFFVVTKLTSVPRFIRAADEGRDRWGFGGGRRVPDLMVLSQCDKVAAVPRHQRACINFAILVPASADLGRRPLRRLSKQKP